MSAKKEIMPPFEFSIIEDAGDEVTIEVSKGAYERDLAAGVAPEETLAPGRYKGTRGGFKKRHPDFNAATAEKKVRVTMYLDADVLEYFKARAAEVNAAPYQTQINNELRRVMEADGHQQQQRQPPPSELYAQLRESLLNDAEFMERIKEKAA